MSKVVDAGGCDQLVMCGTWSAACSFDGEGTGRPPSLAFGVFGTCMPPNNQTWSASWCEKW